MAAIFYGEPRLTLDVDFVVLLGTQDAGRLIAIFPDSDFYVPPSEIIAEEVARRRRGHFNVIHMATAFKADFYPAALEDEVDDWGFRFKREIQFEGETVVLAPPEYVIVRKLEYFREGGSEKHLRDIRSMLAVSGDQIDGVLLDRWVQDYRLEAEWQKASR